VSTRDLDDATVEYAIRYCMGRPSYALEDGFALAETHWRKLSSATRDDVIARWRMTPMRPADHHRWPTIALVAADRVA
jgi:hypothetical protein